MANLAVRRRFDRGLCRGYMANPQPSRGTQARNGRIGGVRDELANYPARVATQWPFLFDIGHHQSFPTPASAR
jgi:hypothetical protein